MPSTPVEPGSSTVEIKLIPDGDQTIIRLIHRGLLAEASELHREVWQHYVDRLTSRAAGEDPARTQRSSHDGGTTSWPPPTTSRQSERLAGN